MQNLRNIHPGEVLKEEFLEPLGVTAYRLSKEIGIPQTRVSEYLILFHIVEIRLNKQYIWIL